MDEKERKRRNLLAVKKYKERNPEKHREATNLNSALYRMRHPERVKKTQKNWQTRNKQKKKKKVYRIVESVRNNNTPRTIEGIKRDIKILKKELKKAKLKI